MSNLTRHLQTKTPLILSDSQLVHFVFLVKSQDVLNFAHDTVGLLCECACEVSVNLFEMWLKSQICHHSPVTAVRLDNLFKKS